MNSIRNNTVDVIRGFAMLLVVLGHTLSGSTCEFHDNLLFQIIWTLQMPLFIIISGYVTKYSQPITSARGLLKFIKKRTIAYLLPWTVWTFIVRGLIFMKDGLLDIKYLLWNMDSGYWFLVTIWTISIVYGCSDYLSNRISKKDNVLVLFHIVWCTVGMGILGLVGFTMGLSFLCIKLTLYYIPFYLAGYLYGHYQEYILKLHNGRNYINYIVALCLALWLSLINRIDFYNIPDSGIIIALRAATSLVGCVAVIGLFTSFCSKIVGGGILQWSGVHSLEIYLTHYLCLNPIKMEIIPTMQSLEGIMVLISNFALVLILTVVTIKLLQSNGAANYILYAKIMRSNV